MISKRVLSGLLVVLLLLFVTVAGALALELDVVVVLDDPSSVGLFSVFSNNDELNDVKSTLDDAYEFKSFKGVSGRIKGDIEFVSSLSGVKGVELVHPVSVSLEDSVGLVGADSFWVKDNSSFTGVNQSVCVIDTGIDFNHSAFGGSWGDVVVAGMSFLSSNPPLLREIDCSVNNDACMDGHGHGTHVAGIVRGVAPNVSLVVVKALEDTGDGFSSDVQKGVDYCLSVAEEFNITVISLSLGSSCEDGFCYSTFCDSVYPAYASLFDAAKEKNISVVVSTGNEGQSDAISAPSCLSSAFRVASSTKSDALSSFNNIWAEDLMLAPGHGINSTDLNNDYRRRWGTSMAAPHVSGAFVLLRDYYGLNVSNDFLGEVLFNQSVVIYDSVVDKNFSRLNLAFNGLEPSEPLPPGNDTSIVIEGPEIVDEPEEPVLPRRGGGGPSWPEPEEDVPMSITDVSVPVKEVNWWSVFVEWFRGLFL